MVRHSVTDKDLRGRNISPSFITTTWMLSIWSSYVHCSMTLNDIINRKVQFLVHLQRMSIHPAGDELTCSRMTMTDAALRTSRGRSPSTSTSSPHTTTACRVCCDCARAALGKWWVFCRLHMSNHPCRKNSHTLLQGLCEQCCCKKQSTVSTYSKHFLQNFWTLLSQ